MSEMKQYIVIEDRLDKRGEVIWDARIIEVDSFIPGQRLNAVEARYLAHKLLKLADALQTAERARANAEGGVTP